MSGPVVWSVLVDDNYECGGIESLHWSLEGAMQAALDRLASEDEFCLAETGKRMALVGPHKWQWQHCTIEVKEAEIKP